MFRTGFGKSSQRLVACCVLWMGGAFGGPGAVANPYGVTGVDWRPNRGMVALGMPPGSWAIHWGVLQSTNVPQMPRPCKPGTNCLFNSYHPDTDTIHDATTFAQWVLANPGKVWVLGNEPDNPTADGDGMTQPEYAAMYHRYFTFIRPLDPTARFVVGAVSGDAVPGDLEHDTAWWETVLNLYRTAYGQPMPVDIWNYHCYAPPHMRDVEEYMAIYVDPFCNWVRTVDGGRYAGAEIWTTEFGIGFWHGPLNMRWVEPWMQRVCLRLEQSSVDRWFWFLGHWDNSGKWPDTCLLDAANRPTRLGLRYSALANGYPNSVIDLLPEPTPVPAPAVFHDTFDDGDISDWIDKAGPWIAEAGALRCNFGATVPPWWGYHILQPFFYGDLRFEADVRINQAPDPMNWAGLYFRFPAMFGGRKQGGYLVYLRQNGELGLYTQQDGTVASVPAAATNTAVFRRVRVDCTGQPASIRVYLDGNRLINWTDPNGRFRSGFAALESGRTDCTFDNVTLTALGPATMDLR